MRRKPGALLPIEEAILSAGLQVEGDGNPEFHGFAIAKRMQEHGDTRKLTAHGTLYKALDRMEKAGLLASRWEDAAVAAEEQRPRRRLYTVTGTGADALAAALATRPLPAPNRPGLAAP